MSEHRVKGLICLKDDLGFEYVVSKIEYCLRKNDDFEYKFIPNYSTIELLDSSIFQGIPGLDLTLHKKEYVRRNKVPVFISERCPSENREDLWEILTEAGMSYLDPLQWLIVTDKKYIGDRLYVKKDEGIEDKITDLDETIASLRRSVDVLRVLIKNICLGCNIQYEGVLINDGNRKMYYDLLYRMYKKEANYISKRQKKGIEKARQEGKYQGRKAINVDDIKLQDTVKRYNAGHITSDEAAKLLGVSKSTFYRRIKSAGKVESAK